MFPNMLIYSINSINQDLDQNILYDSIRRNWEKYNKSLVRREEIML